MHSHTYLTYIHWTKNPVVYARIINTSKQFFCFEDMIKNSLKCHLLAADPLRFVDGLSHSVILVISQKEDFTLGLHLNKLHPRIDIDQLSSQFGIDLSTCENDPIYQGGFNNPNRIYVLHSQDWLGYYSDVLETQLALTADLTIFSALSQNQGPTKYKIFAGFHSWEGNSLEQEILDSKWWVLPYNEDLVFSQDNCYEHWHSVIKTIVGSQVNHWFNELH